MTKRRRWSRLIAFVRRSRLETVAAAAIAGLVVATVVVTARGTVRTVTHDAQSTQAAQAGRVAAAAAAGQGSVSQRSPDASAAATSGAAAASPNSAAGSAPGASGAAGSAAPAPATTSAPVPVTPVPLPPSTIPPVPVPSSPAPSAGIVTITADTAGTVRVSSGETVYLVLSVPGRYFSPPQTSNPYVMDVTSATNSRTGVAMGTFHAVTPGDAVLSSTGAVCPDPSCAGSSWQVTVQVV